MDKKALIETLKSFLRGLYFSLLGVVGTAIAGLAANESVTDTYVSIGGVYMPIGIGIAAALAGFAKLIDRYIHKNENIDLNGITPVDLLER